MAEKTEITVPATETTATFKIISNVSWKATAADNSWVSEWPDAGDGSTDFVVRFEANTGAERSVTFSLTSDEIPGYTLELKLTQSAPLGAEVITKEINFVGWGFPVAEGDSWTTTYADHTVVTEVCTIQMNKWNKQNAGASIDDCPVTKGAGDPPLVLKMTGGEKIVSVSILLKKCGTKAQTALFSPARMEEVLSQLMLKPSHLHSHWTT